MKARTKSSLRQKKRYIVFRVHSEHPLPFFVVEQALFSAVQDWLGEEQAARANLWLIKNTWNGRTGFLRCSHTAVDDVKVALALIHQIGDEKTVFQTLKVAGTIASGKKAVY